nr:immunoglobulin light chain junction region [Macaca mulatta]MOW74167.1 immunoglobulin light chain junction region [Macaca mulatta]MOW74870.1 immunoglobulin light chain junction region [Macaca mulatta]
CMQGIQLPYSC